MTVEEYIKNNRHTFDTAIPGAHGWNGVEGALKRLETADKTEAWLLYNRVLLDTATPAASIWAGIEQALDAQVIKSDPLEQFIQSNRAEFDHAMPSLDVWAQIQQHVPEAGAAPALSVSWRRNIMRFAAAVALLVTGAAFGILFNRSQNDAMAGMKLSDVSSEYAELEQHYERDIAVKKEKLAQFTSNTAQLSEEEDLGTDLEKMDKTMEELRLELANVPPGNREQVVRAMIENYKTKAAILERVLKGLEQQQQFNNNSNNTGSKHENVHI